MSQLKRLLTGVLPVCGTVDIVTSYLDVLAIVGYRGFIDNVLFCQTVDQWIQTNGVPGEIISGGCRGADTLAEQYAPKHKIDFHKYPPDWKRYPSGNTAYTMRDREMAKACTHMIAFPCMSKGKGTQPVSYTHLRAHETRHDLVCRLL